MKSIFLLLVLFIINDVNTFGQDFAYQLRGRVIESKQKDCVSGFELLIAKTDIRTRTDKHGQFVFPLITTRHVEIVSTSLNRVVYSTIIQNNNPPDIEIVIDLLIDKISVESNTSAYSPDTYSIVEHPISSKQITDLTPIAMSDPIRGLSALPGLSSNDDLSSSLILRGSGPDRIAFIIDGVQTSLPTHSIGEGQGGGSVSSLNSHSIGSISLLTSNSSVRYGDGTSGTIVFETKEGNRNEHSLTVNSGLVNSSIIVDGPIMNHRGAYLVSSRYSYMNYALRQMRREGLFMNFSDLQSRILYEVNENNQIGLTTVFGNSSANRNRIGNNTASNELTKSVSDNHLVIGHWNFSPNSRLSLQTRIFDIRAHLQNYTLNVIPAQQTAFAEWGLRQDLMIQAGSAHLLTAGVYYRSNKESHYKIQQTLINTNKASLSKYLRVKLTSPSFYIQDEWKLPGRYCSLRTGFRGEYSSVTGESIILPRISYCFLLGSGSLIRAGIGQQAQHPKFSNLSEIYNIHKIKMEKSIQISLAYDHTISKHVTLSSEYFYRHDSNLHIPYDSYLVLINYASSLSLPSNNLFLSKTEGADFRIRSNDTGNYKGWIAYTYAITNFAHPVYQLTYPGNYDQRHSVSAFSSLKIKPSIDISLLWRYGSGLPFLGIGAKGINSDRLPNYSRMDIRLNKQVRFNRAELTFSFEIMNVTGHRNIRQIPGGTESVLPFLPVGGLSIRFR